MVAGESVDVEEEGAEELGEGPMDPRMYSCGVATVATAGTVAPEEPVALQAQAVVAQ